MYDFAKDTPTFGISKKAGADTFSASYGIKDEAATLSWSRKPFKVCLRANSSSYVGVRCGSVARGPLVLPH